MHENFYVIQLLIEADVIKLAPPNHISNKSEGAGLDNCDLICYCMYAGMKTYLRIRLAPWFVVGLALTFERPNL